MMRVLLALLLVLVTSNVTALKQDSVTVEVLAKSTNSWDGAALPAYPAGTAEITVLRIHIPGHSTLAWHKHPVINAGVVISGRLKVITRTGDELLMQAGEALVETVETWHSGINEHAEPVDIIVFYAGTVDTPLSIQQDSAGKKPGHK